MIPHRRFVASVALILLTVIFYELYDDSKRHLRALGPSFRVINMSLYYSVQTSSSRANPPVTPHSGSAVPQQARSVVTQLKPAVDRDCDLLRAGDKAEVEAVADRLTRWRNAETDAQFAERMRDCGRTRAEFAGNFYVSAEELSFPLAFILVVHTSPQQVVRLLKAIYRSHNLYCVHPDARRGEAFATVFRHLASCLENVFVASRPVAVYYPTHTILEAQLRCMEDLVAGYERDRWRVVINLCGRELPLRTNREMVRALAPSGEANILEAVPVRERSQLWTDRFAYRIAVNGTSGRYYYTRNVVGPAPYGIKLYKSYAYLGLCRPFVEYVLRDVRAMAFRRYLQGVRSAEEHFFASLSKLPDSPCKQAAGTRALAPAPLIFKNVWMNRDLQPRVPFQSCAGKTVHFTCIATSADLKEIHAIALGTRPIFFFNKYFQEDDHVVMDCFEERLVHQNQLEYKNDRDHHFPL